MTQISQQIVVPDAVLDDVPMLAGMFGDAVRRLSYAAGKEFRSEVDMSTCRHCGSACVATFSGWC